MLSHETKASIGPDVAAALAEDVRAGDISASLVDADAVVGSQIVARNSLIVRGEAWVNEVYRQLDESIIIDWYIGDNGHAEDGDVVCKLVGPTGPLRTGERTALDFLETLSALATSEARFAAAIEGTGARLVDTDSTPGVAVADYDAFLEALKTGAERIRLRNFSLEALAQAVATNAGFGYVSAELEASGNFTLETVRDIAKTGVDGIALDDVTENAAAAGFEMLFRID